jgi:hypothetical protein
MLRRLNKNVKHDTIDGVGDNKLSLDALTSSSSSVGKSSSPTGRPHERSSVRRREYRRPVEGSLSSEVLELDILNLPHFHPHRIGCCFHSMLAFQRRSRLTI